MSRNGSLAQHSVEHLPQIGPLPIRETAVYGRGGRVRACDPVEKLRARGEGGGFGRLAQRLRRNGAHCGEEEVEGVQGFHRATAASSLAIDPFAARAAMCFAT